MFFTQKAPSSRKMQLWKIRPSRKSFPMHCRFLVVRHCCLHCLPSQNKLGDLQNKTTRASRDLASRFRIKPLVPSSHDVAAQIVQFDSCTVLTVFGGGWLKLTESVIPWLAAMETGETVERIFVCGVHLIVPGTKSGDLWSSPTRNSRGVPCSSAWRGGDL